LSGASAKLLHAAPMRDVPWFGPSDDPDNPTNDTAHAENWAGDRTVRADVVHGCSAIPTCRALYIQLDSHWPALVITGSLDLSLRTVDKPLTLIRCYGPTESPALAHLQDITVRRSRNRSVLATSQTSTATRHSCQATRTG